jgi:hypothetical protein
LNFDQTYITIFGRILFEPVTFATNTVMMLFCVLVFVNLSKYKLALARQWAWFFLLIGISSQCGAVAHGVQYQLGDAFIRTVVFLVNALSLIAIYFCFKAANTYYFMAKPNSGKLVTYLVIFYIAVLLAVTFIQNNFLLIKIHAGVVLLYSFIIHLIAMSRKQAGSANIAAGIFISFLSILVHSIKLSFHEWFNYKDISHVIMIISLAVIYSGVTLIAKGNSQPAAANI